MFPNVDFKCLLLNISNVKRNFFKFDLFSQNMKKNSFMSLQHVACNSSLKTSSFKNGEYEMKCESNECFRSP